MTPSQALSSVLNIAVPLLLDDLRTLSPSDAHVRAGRWRAEAVEAVIEFGDELQYGGPNCARTFDALARGVAAVSYYDPPGGIAIDGVMA